MRNTVLAALALSVSVTSAALADEFDYDIGIGYDTSSRSSVTSIAFGPTLPVEPITFSTDLDSDDLQLAGNWYFSGVTSNEGPRSRAVFLSRASSLGLSVARTEGDLVTRVDSSDPAIPSSITRGDQSGNTIGVDLRYVWPSSGWFVLAGFAIADLEVDGGLTSTDLDANGYVFGVGKYLGERTAIDLILAHSEVDASIGGISDSSDGSDIAVSLTHIGDMGTAWQYGVDLGAATDDIGGSDFAYDVRGSLYPNRNVAFGIGIEGALGSSDADVTRYEVFGSWFPSEKVGIEASYGWVSFDDPPGINSDEDQFGISGVVRF